MIVQKGVKNIVTGFSLPASFFLLAYFVCHEFNDNFGLIKPGIVISLFAQYACITTCVFMICWLLFCSYTKGSALTFLVMMFFLFFGAAHDYLKSLTSNHFLRSYIFILPFFAVIFLILFFLIKNKNVLAPVLCKCFSAFSVILLSGQIILLSFNIIFKKEEKNVAIVDRVSPSGFQSGESNPDIFYIVFDSYTSSDCLLSDFGYSNAWLDSILSDKNFFIARRSFSNYPSTPFSIASCLGLNFLNQHIDVQKALTSKNMLQGAAAVEESEVPELLRANGYHVYNYSVFNLKGFPATAPPYFSVLARKTIDEQTLWGRFKKDLLWNFTLSTTANGKTKITDLVRSWRTSYIKDFIDDNIAGLIKTAQSTDSSAKFIYCHVMLPHQPYYFRKDGSFWPDSVMFDKSDIKDRFLQQTIYANNRIKLILDSIMLNRKRPYVIILQGDHGFRDFNNPMDKSKIFKNLNAFYFSDHNYSKLYDSISNVNTFRIVFNKYFGTNLAILKDTAIYIKDPSFNLEKNNRPVPPK